MTDTTPAQKKTKILLASSSPYRKLQLEQLGLLFESASPNVDESPTPLEHPKQLAERLATLKAQKLADHYPNHVIIAGDQTATLDNCTTLPKPETHIKAVRQLQTCSGNTVTFYSSICVYSASSQKSETQTVETQVKFRTLSDRQIEHYLQQDKPYDCAGSFKCERLGIALFEQINSSDPSALIGLPLIALTSCLYTMGIDVLTNK